MMKKMLLFFCFLLGFFANLWGQKTLILQIDQETIDSYQILLLDADKKLIQGKTAFESSLTLEIPETVFQITVRAFGFLPFEKVLDPSLKEEKIKIQLQPEILEEIVIVEKPTQLKLEEGNLVADVANSPTLSNSNSAQDLLNKIPKLRADEEKVEIAGRGQATILLNGNPVSADLLAQINAEEVQKVEILENTSSKYSAITKGGPAVNIVLKKPLNKIGIRGRVMVAGEILRYFALRTGGFFEYSQGEKFKIRAGYLYLPQKKIKEEILNIQNTNTQNFRELEQNQTISLYNNHNLFLSADYRPSLRHSLQWTYFTNYRNPQTQVKGFVNTNGSEEKIDEERDRQRFSQYLQFQHKIKLDTSIDHSLQWNLQYTPLLSTEYRKDFLLKQQKYKIDNHPLQARMDYRYPMVKYNLFFETGGLYSFSQEKNQNTLNGQRQQTQITDHLGNLYLQIGQQIKQLYYQIGFSAEALYRIFSFQKNTLLWNYVPRFKLTYQPNANNQWAFNYNFTIAQPSSSDLSPLKDFSSSRFVFRQGNPDLKASYTHYSQLDYSWKSLLFFTLSYQYTQNPWFYLIEKEENTGYDVEKPINIDRKQQINLGITVPYQYKIWRMQYVLQFTNQFLDLSNFAARVPYWAPGVYLSSMQELLFPNDYTMGIRYAYSSEVYKEIVQNRDFHDLSVMMNKKWAKKYTLSLEYQNILYQKIRTFTANTPLEVKRILYADTHRISLRFSVQFGKWSDKERDKGIDYLK